VVFKTREIASALNRKGFKLNKTRDSHHDYYFLYKADGEKTNISTHLSRGHHDIDDYLINKMSKQIGIKSEEFSEFVKCNISHEELLDILNDNNRL